MRVKASGITLLFFASLGTALLRPHYALALPECTRYGELVKVLDILGYDVPPELHREVESVTTHHVIRMLKELPEDEAAKVVAIIKNHERRDLAGERAIAGVDPVDPRNPKLIIHTSLPGQRRLGFHFLIHEIRHIVDLLKIQSARLGRMTSTTRYLEARALRTELDYTFDLFDRIGPEKLSAWLADKYQLSGKNREIFVKLAGIFSEFHSLNKSALSESEKKIQLQLLAQKIDAIGDDQYEAFVKYLEEQITSNVLQTLGLIMKRAEKGPRAKRALTRELLADYKADIERELAARSAHQSRQDALAEILAETLAQANASPPRLISKVELRFLMAGAAGLALLYAMNSFRSEKPAPYAK